jgi:hypothetical protein
MGRLIQASLDKQGGWMPFDRFMALALYAPGLGYYSGGQQQIGRMPQSGSDFVTAPEISPLFGQTLASQLAQALLQTTETIGRLRKRWFRYGTAKVICTYHPSYLLRNPAAKRDVWEDMKALMADLGVEHEVFRPLAERGLEVEGEEQFAAVRARVAHVLDAGLAEQPRKAVRK